MEKVFKILDYKHNSDALEADGNVNNKFVGFHILNKINADNNILFEKYHNEKLDIANNIYLRFIFNENSSSTYLALNMSHIIFDGFSALLILIILQALISKNDKLYLQFKDKISNANAENFRRGLLRNSFSKELDEQLGHNFEVSNPNKIYVASIFKQYEIKKSDLSTKMICKCALVSIHQLYPNEKSFQLIETINLRKLFKLNDFSMGCFYGGIVNKFSSDDITNLELCKNDIVINNHYESINTEYDNDCCSIIVTKLPRSIMDFLNINSSTLNFSSSLLFNNKPQVLLTFCHFKHNLLINISYNKKQINSNYATNILNSIFERLNKCNEEITKHE